MMRSSSRRIVGAVAAFAVISCSTPEQRLAGHLEDGARFADEGRVEAAILEFQSAMQIDPNNAELNERLASQLKLIDDPTARFYYRDAFRLDPERTAAAIKSVQIMIKLDLNNAENLIREVLEANPRYAPAYIAKSDIALIRNNSRGALVSARRATQVDPEDWKAWFQLGKAYRARILERRERKWPYSEADTRNAIEAFAKADELAGGSVRARVERARVFGAIPGSRNLAERQFKQALELADSNGGFQGRLFVAQAAVEYARTSGSRGFLDWGLRNMIDAAPDHLGAWSSLATLENVRGGNGLKVMQELIAKRPTDVYAQLMYANYLIAHSKGRTAAKHLRALLDSGFDAPEFWEQLTRIQIRRKKIANARASYVKMLDSHPDHPISRRTGARIAIAEGRFDAASETLRALAHEADDPNVQYLLARSELARGDLASAAVAIERALPKEGKPPVDMLRLKAHIHHDSNEWKLAIDTYRSLRERRIKLQPAERVRLATCLYENGSRNQGRALLEALRDEGLTTPEAATEYARRESQQNPDAAYRYLVQALERTPAHFELLDRLTWIDLAAGRFGAVQRLNSAIDSGRATAPVLLLRAKVRTYLQQFDLAERDALRALEADPSLDGAVDLLFETYRDRGTLDQTQASFAEAEAAGVLHPGAQQLLARIYHQNDRRDLAREMLEKAVAAAPKMLGAQADLAILLADTDSELDRALELAEHIQQLNGRNPKAADAVGYVYLRKGLNEAALEQFGYALELARSDRVNAAPLYHYHSGLALLALNRSGEATDAFERALAIDPDFVAAEDARIQLEARSLDPQPPSPS